MGPGGLGPPEMPDARTQAVSGQPRASQKSWAPGRKFLAAGTGLGLGGNIAIIVAYYFPDMPATVTAAYGGIVMYFVTLLVTYLVPSGAGLE